MGYFRRHMAVMMLFAVLSMPLAVSAQATSTPAEGWNASPSEVQQRIRDWRGQSSELQQKVQALGSVASVSVFMPVLFGVGIQNISPNFGDARDGGTRTHLGEDIMAVKGTPIVSPTDAVVIRTGTGTGEGNYVTTANPGGETFVYMHLDHFGEGVSQGTVLKQGSLIGYVGNTGNASGGAAHLHLEIHNSSGVATDPFPRLTSEFTPAQKMSFLTTIFGQTADPVALSQFLVTYFRSTFTSAAQDGVALPPLITGALSTVPATAPTGGNLPTGDLMLGSSGTAVVNLQKFLIAKATGTAAVRLAGAGATGYFGSMTEAALIEYQTSVGISPANGYYGPATRSRVEAAVTTPPTGNTPSSNGTTLSLGRNLFEGVSGEDVRALQVFLNTHGFTVSQSGPGSTGNETPYFGPATRAAVVAFQRAHQIEPAAGYVGLITRAAIALI
ncbi:peptidoglycan-binding protein [Candidatus Kaiserbacteria bacterium]|nr:peptidoglycan-binding protein [Candidatus Kaiserbacteria bacterium]